MYELLSIRLWIDLIHNPTMHLLHIPQCHSEQKCAHFCSEWCIVWYGTGVLWDLWEWFIKAKNIYISRCNSTIYAIEKITQGMCSYTFAVNIITDSVIMLTANVYLYIPWVISLISGLLGGGVIYNASFTRQYIHLWGQYVSRSFASTCSYSIKSGLSHTILFNALPIF